MELNDDSSKLIIPRLVIAGTVSKGLHGFHGFKLFENLSQICPCHCTQYVREMLGVFQSGALECGAGLVSEL